LPPDELGILRKKKNAACEPNLFRALFDFSVLQ